MSKSLVTFSVLWFGSLPDYFHVWAKTAEHAASPFRWLIFSDAFENDAQLSNNVRVRSFSRSRLAADARAVFGRALEVRTSARNFLLKCCDFRLYLPLLIGDSWFDDAAYWGWTDIDMVYGDLSSLIPSLTRGAGMVTAHSGRPCGPFTLLRKDLQTAYLHRAEVLDRVSAEEHARINEDPDLYRWVLEAGYEVYENDEQLQPGMNVMPYSGRMAKWTPSGLSVRTEAGWKSSAIFHFSKLLRPGFWVAPDIQPRTPLTIDRFGIRPQGSGPPLSAIGRRYWWLSRRYLNRKLRAHALRP